MNKIRTLVFDVEAAAIGDAAAFLEEPTAPANYTKPEAIAKYVEKAKAEQLDKCALDLDLARIVAVGVHYDGVTEVRVCRNENEERDTIAWFWSLVGSFPYPRLIGYNVNGYDLPLLKRRSLYLGLTAPDVKTGKYRHPDVDDLMLHLSEDGQQKFRSLRFYLKRFGLPHDDLTTGADVADMVRAGDYAAVAAHCRCDVEGEAALARRLGFLPEPEVAEVF